MTLDWYNKSQRQLDKLVYVLSPTADENIIHEMSAYFLIESCFQKTCPLCLRAGKTQISLLWGRGFIKTLNIGLANRAIIPDKAVNSK